MLPSATDRSPAPTADPAEFPGSLIRVSLDVSRRWTSAYFDGLDKALDFQLKLAQSYASAGEQQFKAATAVADRAERAGSEATKAVAKTADRAAKTQAKTADRAAKPKASADKTADRTAKSQAAATKPADRAAKPQSSAAKSADRPAKPQTAPSGPTAEPLPDYEQLTAEEIVAKLPAVSQRTLAEVAKYERAHDARATVLGRVESLTGNEPAPGYDELTVADIQQLLTDGDEELAKRVRQYERAHGARTGVLQAAERQLDAA